MNSQAGFKESNGWNAKQMDLPQVGTSGIADGDASLGPLFCPANSFPFPKCDASAEKIDATLTSEKIDATLTSETDTRYGDVSRLISIMEMPGAAATTDDGCHECVVISSMMKSTHIAGRS